MIEPLQSDEALLADIQSVPTSPARLDVWWLGQSTLLAVCNGVRVLFDPYLSDSLTEKYKTTDKPHVRMSRRVVAPGNLSAIDIVTCSHIHTDHLDALTLNPLFASNPQARLIYPRAIQKTVGERVVPPAGGMVAMNADETATVGLIRFDAVASAHDTLQADGDGNQKALGYVVRFGSFAVYHSGDGVVYKGLAEAVRALGPVDLAILPINGKVGNMNGAEAARFAKDIGARLVVPCHYHLFEFNTAEPGELFVPECERLNQPHRVLRLGERLTLEATSP